jgi:ferredoxin
MASPVHRALIRAGFSERFLRTTAGNHPAMRAEIAVNPGLWELCGNCGKKFVLVSRISTAVPNKDGTDLRRNPIMPHKFGLCSSHCAIEHYGVTEKECYAHMRAAKFARRKDFHSTKEWRDLRYQALAKHGNSCQCCGRSPAVGAVMHVDHIKPKVFYPHLCLSLDNLQVLCDQCNLGKSYKDQTDWRAAS